MVLFDKKGGYYYTLLLTILLNAIFSVHFLDQKVDYLIWLWSQSPEVRPSLFSQNNVDLAPPANTTAKGSDVRRVAW